MPFQTRSQQKPTPQSVRQRVLLLQACPRQNESCLSNKHNVFALLQARLGYVRRTLLSLYNNVFSSHELFKPKPERKLSVKQDTFCTVFCLKSLWLQHTLLYRLTGSLLTGSNPACNSAKTLHSTAHNIYIQSDV